MGVVLPQPIQFGKYTLFERIGRGGMADVFKGRVQGPAGFERVFVVKRILPHLSDDPQFTRMFIDEAKLSARLNHPNIVQVFELGNVDSEYFIAMEYVRGRDLSETMRTLWSRIGPPRPEFVAYIGREMCRALAYAHDLTTDDGAPLGMIHRDVSPSNVMLSYEGAVKLLDFGIAKALGGEAPEDTGRGTLKGKFAYMAPEQTQGSNVDRRIDIFATGIVLHEVLTGRRLFKGENDLQTVERVRQCDVPPPSATNPLCPPELDAILYRALARDRDERFQTASEMADALDDVVHAARFQPTHLAQLMRDLFPGDTAGGAVSQTSPRVTSASISVVGSRPQSQSHSHSQSHAARSPGTIPPVSVSVSRTGSTSPSRSLSITPGPHPYALAPSAPFYKRGSFWFGGVLAVGIAFGGGVIYTRQNQPPASAGLEERKVEAKTIAVRFTTFPAGVRIYEFGTNRFIGTSDGEYPVLFKDGMRATVILKKEDHEDQVKEIRAHAPVIANMRPVPPPDRKSGRSERRGGADERKGRTSSAEGSSASPTAAFRDPIGEPVRPEGQKPSTPIVSPPVAPRPVETPPPSVAPAGPAPTPVEARPKSPSARPKRPSSGGSSPNDIVNPFE